MSVIKLKITATTIIEIDPNDAVDYEGLEDYFPEGVEDKDLTSTDVAIAMVKWDDEEDSLSKDEFDWEINSIEPVTNGSATVEE